MKVVGVVKGVAKSRVLLLALTSLILTAQITPPQPSGNGLIATQITLTSAQIKSVSSFIPLVTGVPNALIVPVHIAFVYTFGTMAYVNGSGGNGAWTLNYNNASATNITLTNVNTAIKDIQSSFIYLPIPNTSIQDSTTYIGKTLGLAQTLGATRDLVTGDGTCVVNLTYKIVAVSP